MSSPPNAPLCAYEEARAASIRQNRQVLFELGLAPLPLHEGGPLKPRKREKRKKEPAEPTRRSTRQQGEKASGLYVEAETTAGRITLATSGGDLSLAEQWKREQSASVTERKGGGDAVGDVVRGDMPRCADDLLPAERPAFDALRAAKWRRAKELEVAGYHVAQLRSLCEMVRCLPTTCDELREVWGFGGGGKLAQRHGSLFLETLRPFIPALREAHEQAKAQAEAQEATRSPSPSSAANLAAAGEDGLEGREAIAYEKREVLAAAAEARLNEMRDVKNKRGYRGEEIREVDRKEEKEKLKMIVEGLKDEGEGEAMNAGKKTELLPSSLPLPTCPEELEAHELPAFQEMREWKRARARELGYNDPCVICHNRTLCELVRLLPSTTQHLLRVWGMGAKRISLHGSRMLAALAPLRPALLRHREGGEPETSLEPVDECSSPSSKEQEQIFCRSRTRGGKRMKPETIGSATDMEKKGNKSVKKNQQVGTEVETELEQASSASRDRGVAPSDVFTPRVRTRSQGGGSGLSELSEQATRKAKSDASSGRKSRRFSKRTDVSKDWLR
ncbi:MAG: hypothetical protein SGPRY_010339, partial [Prymnesium sp.]